MTNSFQMIAAGRTAIAMGNTSDAIFTPIESLGAISGEAQTLSLNSKSHKPAVPGLKL